MAYLKFKVCRRIGAEGVWRTKKLTPRQNTLISLRKNNKNTNRKQSDFSKRLRHTQKLAFFYGMRSLNNRVTSNICYNYLDKKKSLLLSLETRLDVILVRLFFCSTLFTARQLITHKKICVNFKPNSTPGTKLKNGDLISILPSHVDLVKSNVKFHFQNNARAIALSALSNHLEVNYKTLNAILLYEPTQIYFPYKIDLDILF